MSSERILEERDKIGEEFQKETSLAPPWKEPSTKKLFDEWFAKQTGGRIIGIPYGTTYPVRRKK